MKQEQVIELAKQAGFFYYDMRSEGHGETLEADSLAPVLMFAKLVEQATLEQAAKVCDAVDACSDGSSPWLKDAARSIRNLAKESK